NNQFVVFAGLAWVDPTRVIERSDADFLILHAELGFLFIEAKSGVVRHRDRQWERLKPGSGADGEWTRITDPWLQSERSMHHVLGILQARRVVRMNELRYSHAVAFPHARRFDGQFPLNVTRTFVLLREDRESLESWVCRALDVGRPRPIPGDRFEAIVEALKPDFQVVETLSDRIESDEPELVRLTSQQQRVLDFLGPKRKRVLVQGEAGSGKTLVAAEAVRRLCGRHPEGRFLMLTYHLPIAASLRRMFAAGPLGDRVDVFGFHEFAEHVVRTTGGSWPDDIERRSPEEKQEFYDNVSPALLESALHVHTVRYAGIVVDEGQDFWYHWWPVIEEGLADAATGYLFVFFDERQDVHAHDYVFPIEDEALYLGESCRSTARISRFNDALIGLDRELGAGVPEGIEPVVHFADGEDDEWQAVRRILHRLTHEEGLRPEQIVLVGRHPFDYTAYARRPRIGNLQVVKGETVEEKGRIRYTTAGRFKGLEADCVIVVGFDDLFVRHAAIQTRLYVACSRAKHVLHVILRMPRTVLVKDLAPSVTEAEIVGVLQQLGTVDRVDLGPSSRSPGAHRAYVEFASGMAARTAANNLSGAVIGGTPVRTSLCVSTRARELLKPAPTVHRVCVLGMPPGMDSAQLAKRFGEIGPVLSAEIPPEQSDSRLWFGFVSMAQPKDVARAIARFDGTDWDGQRMRVLRAHPRGATEEPGRSRAAETHDVFVGGLDTTVTREQLVARFEACQMLAGIDIPTAPGGGHRGFAFLRFRSRAEAEAAITEIDGAELAGRRLQAGWPRPRRTEGRYGVYVGNLPETPEQSTLEEEFSRFGACSLKVMRGFAFANFETRSAAERAIEAMNGRELLGRVLSVRRSDRGWSAGSQPPGEKATN
ncbi:MAG: DEAD/DEAH box helicase family protein, partial [Phycisphaerales bacterium]|nr:DEAD/DEAH box helicase family protein [Phycisphaerales bacterium]